MTTFRVHLQRLKNQGNKRIRFSLETLRDPKIAEIYRATIERKFAPLLALENQDTETDALINSFNAAVTETANNILGKHRPAKTTWVTNNILNLCDKRRELKQKTHTTKGAKLYTEAKLKRHEKIQGDMDCRTMPRYRRKPAEKQQQDSLPTCERTDKFETRENYYHP